MRTYFNEFINSMNLNKSDLDYLFKLDKTSKGFLKKSSGGDVLQFKIIIPIGKYKETFYMNSIQIGLKTVECAFYNTISEADNDLEKILTDTVQNTLF